MTKKLIPWLVVAALAALSLPAAAQAADECRGLPVCISVPGPWVVIPARAGDEVLTTFYELRCPRRGFIVGGLDAELSDPAIEVTFIGALGSPVTPGVTTSRTAVFAGTYGGAARQATSFRPLIGCIPSSGGGRERTGRAAPRAFPPGMPTIRRVRTIPLPQNRSLTVAHSCRRGERLLASSYAIAFHTPSPPDARLIASVRVTLARRGDRLVIRAARGAGPRARAEVQVHAICGRS